MKQTKASDSCSWPNYLYLIKNRAAHQQGRAVGRAAWVVAGSGAHHWGFRAGWQRPTTKGAAVVVV